MPKKIRKNELKRIMQQANIYDLKLDCQIAQVARLEEMVEKLHARLNTVDPISFEITTNGAERAVLNPLYPAVLKLEAQLQDGYKALGLNYDAKPSNIRESAVPEKEEEGGIQSFLNNMGGDK